MIKLIELCFFFLLLSETAKGNYGEYENLFGNVYENYPSFDEDSTIFIPPPINECVLDSLDSLLVVDITSIFVFSNEDKKLNTIVKWNVSSRGNKDVEFDGFLVHLTPSNNLDEMIKPKYLCDTGDQYWIHTTDSSECSSNATSCNNLEQFESFCVSNTSNQSQTNESCTHWNKQGMHFSIPKTVRNLTFDIEFLNEYHFFIVPYYREYISPNYVYAVNHVIYSPTCLDFMTKTSQRNKKNAGEYCCGLNVTEIDVSKVRNVSFGNFRVDPGLRIVNLTATWLPPAVQDKTISFTLTTLDIEDYTLIPNNFVDHHFWNPVQSTRIPINGSNHPFRAIHTPEHSCDKTEYYYSVVLSDLKPGKTYNVMITTNFATMNTYSSRCQNENCVSFKKFKVPEMNVCDFNYCHKNAICTPVDITGITSLHATCMCNSGFEGNGVNPTTDPLGNGCVDQNDCKYAEDVCSDMSQCIDNIAPHTGVNCLCPHGHYGDGYKDGTGCQPIYELALKISVPLLFAFLLLFSALVCKVKYQRNKRNRTPTNKTSSHKKILLSVIFPRL